MCFVVCFRLCGAVRQLDVSSKSCADSVAAEGGQLSPSQHILCLQKIPDFDGASEQCHMPADES